ncbi:MAG TPA: hydroxyacid dehydrogenase [Terracidiphilus sp.]|nr:hydroxyacid dehydrogenase [Terracidiphilus sp.]
MPEILISENILGAAVEALRARFDVALQPDLWKSPALLAEQVRSCRALIVRNQTPVTAELLAGAAELLVVGRAGAGLDNIDVKAARKAGIVIASTPDQNAISAAELTMGMILSLARMIPAADRETRQGKWSRQKFVGMELYDKTLGIVGAGKIGYLTARRAMAFGMKVLAHDPYLSRDNILLSELKAELVSLDELLSAADVVTCHLPATLETTGLMNGARFSRMKPGALFVNTSRGAVVVEADLFEALNSGALGGAALDVRVTEPPAVGELESLPNVILTPHIAAFTLEAQDRVTRAVCEDVARVLDGKPAINAVGQALPRRLATQ